MRLQSSTEDGEFPDQLNPQYLLHSKYLANDLIMTIQNVSWAVAEQRFIDVISSKKIKTTQPCTSFPNMHTWGLDCC
jgi:hypothetical protein